MWRSFSRSQIAALFATGLDYGILIVWVEVLHQYYPYGVALGAFSGAVLNFFLNRHWSFESTRDQWHEQALRYLFVSSGSLILNILGVYLLTEFAHLYYLVSRIIISILVGLIWNYPLHRSFVYKKKERPHEDRIHFTAPKSEDPSQNTNPRPSQSTPA